VHKVLQDQQVRRDYRELQEQPELPVLLDHRVIREYKVQQGHKAYKVRQVQLVQMALTVQMV